MRILRLHLHHFLSYEDAALEMGDLTALVGPNASGKSNAVAALRLLRDLPIHGLQTAIAKRGGIDSLRHRSKDGLSLFTRLRLEFQLAPEDGISIYEVEIEIEPDGRYRVTKENGELASRSSYITISRNGGIVSVQGLGDVPPRKLTLMEGQTVLPSLFTSGGLEIWNVLRSIQTVDINPAKLRDLQDPSPIDVFEPDGSNAASYFEALDDGARSELVSLLAAIVPGIVRIEPRHLDDKVTLRFYLNLEGNEQEFSARQMSDGTLRIFGILLALSQPVRPSLVVIEEPETAIHVGALQTLVEILRAYAQDFQILLTTHSADIVDSMGLDDLRVVWWENGSSHIAPVAEHMRSVVRKGLIMPGELLRSLALDPAVA
jgi:predicted ATPase